MSESSQQLWSDNPNAPLVPRWVYLQEKANLAGYLLGMICHGIVIVLFIHCMRSLLNPVDQRKGGIKWGLVAHTVAMFSTLTIFIGLQLDILSISYLDNREFPLGPLGYQYSIYYAAIEAVPTVAFQLNQWLADGLLLYRCCVIYAMNFWAVGFPCLLYIASIGVGIGYTYMSLQPEFNSVQNSVGANVGLSYFTVSLSLNIILTLMIVTRLVLHRRNIRSAMGTQAGTTGLYKSIITMLVESCALYSIFSALFISSWIVSNNLQLVVLPVLADVQVIAPLLITLRVANRSALTSEAVSSGVGDIGSMHFRSHGKSTGASETTTDGDYTTSADINGEASGNGSAGAAGAVEEIPR